MALDLKDIPTFGVRPHTHKYLKRIAVNRDISLSELCRSILEAHVDKQVHDAKLLLGIDADKVDQAEFDLEPRENGRDAPRVTRK